LGGEGAFLGNALNFIMAAYMYYAIAMMIIQVVWSCEDIEFELSAKRDLKVCKKIGSWCEVDGGIGCIEKREGFCCFSSPLSRIMNEQIRQQTGNSYGDPEGPNCEGITVDTIQSIDWSQIDLSEWIAILSTTGNMPSPDVDEMMQQYSSGAITGSSSTMANDTNRANVLERTEQRLDESSPNLIEAEMSDGLHQDVERKAQ
jgi:conjugal transfer mating pair stabilization protein TraN